jgi:hypothetical protein
MNALSALKSLTISIYLFLFLDGLELDNSSKANRWVLLILDFNFFPDKNPRDVVFIHQPVQSRNLHFNDPVYPLDERHQFLSIFFDLQDPCILL